jgi:hypothetical protein
MRLLSGGCSRVEYQRIGGPVWSVGCEYGAFFSSERGCGESAPAGCGGCCLAHCWVLRQQGRSLWAGVWLFRFSCMSGSGVVFRGVCAAGRVPGQGCDGVVV